MLYLRNEQEIIGAIDRKKYCLPYLLNQLNGGQKIHTKIDKLPYDTLLLVLLLLEYEHVVVEELLQTLISVVDTQLLKRVEFEYLKSSNIQYTDEVLALLLGVQGGVTTHHHPVEEPGKDTFGQSLARKFYLGLGLTLDYHLSSDLNLGCDKGLHHVVSIDTQKVGDLLSL